MFTEEHVPKPEDEIYFFIDDILSQDAKAVVKLKKQKSFINKKD